jgi:hypothetical protein
VEQNLDHELDVPSPQKKNQDWNLATQMGHKLFDFASSMSTKNI